MELQEILAKALLEPLVVETADAAELRRLCYIARRGSEDLKSLSFRVLSPTELLIGQKEILDAETRGRSREDLH